MISHVGREIKRLRQEKDMGLRELATVADVSPSTLSRIENGKSSLPLNLAHKIAEALDVTIAELLDLPIRVKVDDDIDITW